MTYPLTMNSPRRNTTALETQAHRHRPSRVSGLHLQHYSGGGSQQGVGNCGHANPGARVPGLRFTRKVVGLIHYCSRRASHISHLTQTMSIVTSLPRRDTSYTSCVTRCYVQEDQGPKWKVNLKKNIKNSISVFLVHSPRKPNYIN